MVQGLACISADCEIGKQEADSGLYPNYLFQFINAVLNFENSGLVYEKRANFIIKLNMYKPDKILNVDQYSCESNICSIVDNLGLNFISVKEVCQCEMKTFNAPYLNVNINIVKSSLFQNIQEAVDNCYQTKNCTKCNGKKTVDVKSNCLAFVDTNDCGSTDISKISKELRFGGENFFLRCAICYSGSVANEIGHYVAVCFRNFGTIELYNDMARAVRQIKSYTSMPHLLIYSK